MDNKPTCSHQQLRAFQPEKLSAPRDFILPNVLNNEKKGAKKIGAENNNKKSIPCLIKPLVLEIGAGKGKHALMYATQNPDKHLIAIERTRNKFEAFEKITIQNDLNNLSAIHADAIAWIVHAIATSSVERIYILYPNPEQHNPNQQWLNMPFFEFLLSRLIEGGEIILATNIESYMDNALWQAVHVWQLPNARQRVAVNSARTHFEIKYLARNEACWQLTLSKPKGYKTRFDKWQVQI